MKESKMAKCLIFCFGIKIVALYYACNISVNLIKLHILFIIIHDGKYRKQAGRTKKGAIGCMS